MRQEALQSFDFLFEDSLRRWIEAKRGGGVERVTQSSGDLNRLWDFPRHRIEGREGDSGGSLKGRGGKQEGSYGKESSWFTM